MGCKGNEELPGVRFILVKKVRHDDQHQPNDLQSMDQGWLCNHYAHALTLGEAVHAAIGSEQQVSPRKASQRRSTAGGCFLA